MTQTQWEGALAALFPPEKPLRILCVGDAGAATGQPRVFSAGSDRLNSPGLSAGAIAAALTALAHSVVEVAAASIADCTKRQFEDESVDAVVCYDVMQRLSGEKAAWPEFKRILKKEGHVVLFDTGRIGVEQAQAQGFSHCRFIDIDGINCMSSRKPLKGAQRIMPQISLFRRHIQTTKRQIQLYQSWCQSAGMPYPAYTVLNMVSHHPGGVRPSDISAALVIPPQTLTRILAALQREGHIDRKTNAQDHRSAVITITEAGAEKIKPLQTELREIEKRAFAGFSTDELAAFSALGDKLLKALETAFQKD